MTLNCIPQKENVRDDVCHLAQKYFSFFAACFIGSFFMDNLSLGDNYKPLDAYFKRANGAVIKRSYSKGERRSSNQTLPRIACQAFEKQLAALLVEDKENFPVCKYNPDSDMIRGICTSVDEYKKFRNSSSLEYLTYSYGRLTGV